MSAKPLINMPGQVPRGAIIDIKCLIAHPMETGYRAGLNGEKIPRDIITKFTCAFEDMVVFEAELAPAIAANPYLAFCLRVERAGSLTFTWRGDNGFYVSETRAIEVV